ncbi:hypothetical protein BOX15_Mlig019302g1 [Macrostomum lignano]|uniref:Uncharacterized protein n=2 Tax=Macrostomum lignano TaxID=282301 RepID=A0A267E8A7_9PLAT|nr:hypothetical protein BOX15_Mlig019302g1 [Macrostomum lignano]
MSNVNSCEESDASSYSDASVDSDSEEPKQTSKQQNMKEELDVSLDAGQQRKQLLLAYDWSNKATKKGCKCCNPVSICVSAKVNEKLEKQPWKNMQILRESAAPVNEGQKTLFWKNIPPSQNANKLLTSKDSHDVTPLMLAASAKGSLLKHLREKLEEEALKKAIKMKDHDGNTMLHYAVVSNEAEKIELLVGRGADINAENSDKSTPLLIASALGHTKSVIKLLKLDASKYTKDKQGRTAMHWCFRQQDTDIYDALMKEASEEENDAEFMTPFHWACRQARKKEAMLMVKKNSKLLGKVDAQLRTGLHWAVLANSTGLVKALLQLKTEPNQPATVLSKCLNAGDFQGKSPLHYAAEAGNLNIFKDLVDCGAKLTAIDNDCRTPLHLAVKMGHADFVKKSLDYLEKLKTESSDKETKEQMLLKQHMSIQIRAMEHRDISGMTCLLIAAEQGHPMLFEHLLKFKADFTAKDNIGRNALMLSVGGGHRDIAKKILDKGLDVNATDVNQNTALHYACKHPDPVSCLDFLLEHGAKLQQNGIEETPLDVALMNQNERAIQLFLSEKYFDYTMSYRKADGYSHMKDFIKHMPDAAMLVLNRSVTKHSSEHADFLVEYNFDHLDPGPDEAPTHKHRSKALLKIVEYKRIELLKHPVTTSLLESKIGITGFIFSLDIMLYLLFLSCLTAFVVLNMPPKTSTPFTTAICFNDSNKSSFGWTNNFYRLEDAKEPFKSRLPVAITLGIRLFVGFIKTLLKLYDWKNNCSS